jgi:peptidoglycan/xylan/chitin deacetylase (PgdA/CDA1 family)
MDPRHHRPTRQLAAAALTLTASHAAPALCAHARRLRPVLGVRDRIEDLRSVALTFDDGPDPRGTPAILALLADAGAPATFFVTGEQVRDHPSIAAEIVAAGHEVALHGDRHRNLLRVGPRALREDLLRAQATIAEATGRAVRLYRPPYGVFSASALALARRHGWEPVLWTRWGRDWRAGATPQGVASEVTRELAGGDIVLLHDADRYSARGSWQTTVAALPIVLETVESDGLRCALIPPPVQERFRPAGAS